MKKFLGAAIALVFLLSFSSTCFAVDTLEVFILRVQFKEEKTDNTLTTGTGVFGSDKKDKKAYSLDPVGRRGSVSYWQKHLEFADNYYRAVSGGRLVIKSRVFPDASTGASVYKLDKQIIDYNRTSKKKGEKTAEYDEARSRDYLSFVYDAIAAAGDDTSSVSPFRVPLSKNASTKRVYMIAHAGASRLVDGGSMGTKGADTPGDFMDIYISGDAWEYLMPDSARSHIVRPTLGVNAKGDSVVKGLIVKGAVLDTLRSVMVVSETASQDGLNWGINGIVVNQIARELGLPDTYDVVKGISRLGYYDMMDFAGYNAGSGFFPSMLAAWERLYMGWGRAQEVRPTAGKPVTVKVSAAGSGRGTEIVKVPLNANEYLLIENRQRSWNKDGKVSVILGDDDESTDTTVRTVPVDSLNLVFEDSVCTKGKCKVNPKKASGLILGASSYDAGLPASGIVVWKVNDWYLRETLQYGYANLWGGDTLRDHQYGISLVEADGVLSIGKTFKNMLGEDTYDYGSGTDLLPHRRIPDKKSKKSPSRVTTIYPTGYANTATTQGGYTGIKIKVDIPKNARKERTSNAFMGDSVENYAALEIPVTISIDDGSIEGSLFPREIGLNTAVRGAVFVDHPDDEGEKIMVVASEDGTLQAFSALGDTLFVADTSLRVRDVSRKDSEREVPLYRVAPSFGPLVGLAGDGRSAYSLHRKALVQTKFESGAFPVSTLLLNLDSVKAGPMILDQYLWFVDGHTLKGVSLDDEHRMVMQKFGLPENFSARELVACIDGRNREIVLAGDNAEIHEIRLPSEGSDKAQTEHFSFEVTDRVLRVACTDLDRDGSNEVVAVGSRGSWGVVEKGKGKMAQNTFKRGATGSNGVKDETSGLAIGDINGDHYPEVVFLGDNLVYALDRFGLPLPGFPVKLNRGTPVTGFFSDPLLVDVTGDDVPEILVPSSDGLVYAYTGKAKAVTDGFPLAAGSFEFLDTLGTLYPMSIFVTDAVNSKKSKGPELYAFHRTGVNAFRLNKASNGAEKSATAWALPAAGNERTGFFDATLLGDVHQEAAKDEIKEFFVYPNPVRGGLATARYEIGAAAKEVLLEFYDITGLCVFKTKMTDVQAGRGQTPKMDLRQLATDVYTARLKVKFADGKTKQKLYRVGVIR